MIELLQFSPPKRKKLANNLNERNICEPNNIGDKDTGDGGLDIVAWRALPDDNSPGNLICFAQCACSPDEWEGKLFDAHIDKWRHIIDFVHFPANIMFIPLCFRSSNGDWFNKSEIRSSIVLDRLRICKLLENAVIPDFDFYQTVDEFFKIAGKKF